MNHQNNNFRHHGDCQPTKPQVDGLASITSGKVQLRVELMYWMISSGYRPQANFAPDSASTDKSAGEMKRACRGLKEPSPIRLTDVPALVRTISSLFGARVGLRPSHIHNPNCAPLGVPACMSDQCFSIGQIPPLACCCHNLK